MRCAAGEDPLPYLEAMMAMASPLGMIPEQVWDSRADCRIRSEARQAERLCHAAGMGA